MNEAKPLTLETICDGGVPEVFERELRAVLNNIADPNTEAEKMRGITLKFSFRPTEDRLGASVSFTCKATVEPVAMAKSQVFLSRHTGELRAYGSDSRQALLFGQTEEPKPLTVVS